MIERNRALIFRVPSLFVPGVVVLLLALGYLGEGVGGLVTRFVPKRHAATVLVQPDMMKLSTEQPQLWAELAEKISSNGGATTMPASKKRART